MPNQGPSRRDGGVEPSALGLVSPAPHSAVALERATRLARENLRFVWRLTRRLGLAPSDADDATQRVFFVALGRIGQIEPGSERAFLYRTAVRIALKIKAASSRRSLVEGAPGLELLPHSGPSPEDLSDRQRARDILDQVLEAMPLDLRAVFILFELEHLSVTEVADVLGLPRGTAASRLRRARADFEQRVRRLEARMKFKGGAP